MQRFSNSSELLAIKSSRRHLKRFTVYRVDKQTDTHTHKETLVKTTSPSLYAISSNKTGRPTVDSLRVCTMALRSIEQQAVLEHCRSVTATVWSQHTVQLVNQISIVNALIDLLCVEQWTPASRCKKLSSR